jgi:hypothetical protein
MAYALAESGLTSLPLGRELPGPALVQCTWLRPGEAEAATSAVERLTSKAPEVRRSGELVDRLTDHFLRVIR